MHTERLVASLIGACLATLAFGLPAHANLLISVNKSTQRMTVMVDGRTRYTWPVSTGKRGYDTPSGTFRPFRMDKDHHSDEYDNAPMPYSIFFTMTGNAIHGTYERNLGHAVSHGCVRLSVQHAAVLWSLVKREKMASTTVQVSGSIRYAAASAAARPRLAPMTGARSRQDLRRADRSQWRPLFPFFPAPARR